MTALDRHRDPAPSGTRVLLGLAVLLALAAAGVASYGVSPPEVAVPVPITAEGTAPKKLPPARPVPARPRGPRPELAPREDGLVVWDVVEGTGEALVAGAVAVVEYTGYLPDETTDASRPGGRPFDSTYRQEGPTRFKLGGKRVLPGWDAGLLGMREGGVRQLVIPAAQAFGDRGIPGQVPPGATVTYDFELLDAIGIPETPPPAGEGRDVGGFRVDDLAVGQGAAVQRGKTVRVEYLVWLEDGGKLVDTSYDRTAPFAFAWGNGEVAWEPALEGMAVGGRRRVRVPPERGFGEKGRPPVIPPNAALVLAVEVVAVE